MARRIEQHLVAGVAMHPDGVGEVVHDEAGADDKRPAEHQEAQVATHIAP